MSCEHWMEQLASNYFGAEWLSDARLRGFVEASIGHDLERVATDQVPDEDGVNPFGGLVDGGVDGFGGSSGSVVESTERARFKNQFLAAVSHELRTPLNPILALSQSLRSGVYGVLHTSQHEALGHIEQNAQQLHRLIEDVLDLSAFELGNEVKSALSPARVEELVGKVVGEIGSQAEAKGIAIEVRDEEGIDQHFYVDSARLERALGILLDNAVKFTPQGGSIIVEVVGDEAGGTIGFSITDNGIGIAEDAQAQLFQTFGQLDRTLARAYNGAGLGLALVKHMVEMQGGSVAVSSKLGEGSRFTICLPLHTSSAEHRDPRAAAPANA